MRSLADEISAWLDGRQCRTVLISKQEQGDLDQVRMDIDKVNAGRLNSPDPDDYVPTETILLHGHGLTENTDERARLPQDVYEIPLAGEWETRIIGQSLHIRTDRATYTLNTEA